MHARLDRRRRRLVPGLLLLVLTAAGVAGCEGLVEDIGGGGATRSPADLTTSEAERAAWRDAPEDAVPAAVQRVSDGDTFVATVNGRRERIRVIGVDTPESVAPNPHGPEPDEADRAHARSVATGASERLARPSHVERRAPARHDGGMLGRRPLPEPALTRDEVLDVFGGLADIHANTLEILRILRETDDEEEDA